MVDDTTSHPSSHDGSHSSTIGDLAGKPEQREWPLTHLEVTSTTIPRDRIRQPRRPHSGTRRSLRWSVSGRKQLESREPCSEHVTLPSVVAVSPARWSPVSLERRLSRRQKRLLLRSRGAVRHNTGEGKYKVPGSFRGGRTFPALLLLPFPSKALHSVLPQPTLWRSVKKEKK